MKKNNSSNQATTQNDLKNLKVNLEDKIEESESRVVREMHTVFDELERRFEEKITIFTQKILGSIDKVMKELETIKEEQTVGDFHTDELKKKVENHEKRIKKLEKTPISA